ncbi:hypothetical protein A994_02848 [Methanobacterium formicicum DSM 3637]|uniref:Uncharacterized protein n=1 Tax=Methanobacterium formicicum (strain DSM 3637 / PP1) TaxID=1204725 RepID=K2QE75_METFP|nr:hypothetical protein A994_02848 [Methanobacterium formicicum DSM 3637]
MINFLLVNYQVTAYQGIDLRIEPSYLVRLILFGDKENPFWWVYDFIKNRFIINPKKVKDETVTIKP